MKTNQLRESFLKYFEELGHKRLPSSELIPKDDPTLLFTNAGMNQFKNIFLGLESRDYKRATTSQKCVRAGGKHNDLDNVGFTARHHTFFEMLGNFSFGDYFKKEATVYAWEFVTQQLNLPPDKLYVSVFEEDDEALKLWQDIGVAKDRIVKLGGADNFWRMGNTGPCGPCSEIYYDLGPEVGGDPAQNVVGGDGDRYVEFWNLVFMQYNEGKDGTQTALPNPSIDTGMGLERMASIMQGELSSYHTDENLKLINLISKATKKSYEKQIIVKDPQQQELNVALRVLADHARSTAFLMAEGLWPSNEGRGYVLRRIMRRAIRYGRKISDQSLLPLAVEAVVENMKHVYPELEESKEIISEMSAKEEERFLKTLDQGTEIFNKIAKELKSKKEARLSGEQSFRLYDTYGFPFDLTQIMAQEQGLEVSEQEFTHHMELSKEKARASWKGASITDDLVQSAIELWDKDKKPKPFVEFKGYDHFDCESTAVKLSNDNQLVSELQEGEEGWVIFDQTCCYAEGGGQVGDAHARVSWGESNAVEILDCIKKQDIPLHRIKVHRGSFSLASDQKYKMSLNEELRFQTACHHSATHLLHAALRTVLGDHVAQAGSLVDPYRLRFDFKHPKPLSDQEIQTIEKMVAEQIQNSVPVGVHEMGYQEAIDFGALALFGEKYGDKVRVLKMGDFSVELCGGTHVKNTADIQRFKIISETGVSSGVRRIEALAGPVAVEWLNRQQQELSDLCEEWQVRATQGQNLKDRAQEVLSKIKTHTSQLSDFSDRLKAGQKKTISVDGLVSQARSFGAGELVLVNLPLEDRNLLGEITDKIQDRLKCGVVIVVGQGAQQDEVSHPIIVSVNKKLDLKAGDIIKQINSVCGGRGGGRPHFAQGSIADKTSLSKVEAALLKEWGEV